MAASSSSSNSVSAFPEKELKEEEQQDVSSDIKDVKLMKRELEDSKEAVKREPVDRNDVKRESVDMKNVKEEQWENPFAGLISLLERMDTKESGDANKVEREEDKDVKKESEEDPLAFLDSKEHAEKFQKIEADFKQYLINKYFSDKTLDGDDIFDEKMEIDGQTIKSSRLPPYQSYLDPAILREIFKFTKPGDSTEASGAGNSKPKPPSTQGN